MRIGVGASTSLDPIVAVDDALAELVEQLGFLEDSLADLSLILIAVTPNHDLERLLERLLARTNRSVPITGCTICQGVLRNRWSGAGPAPDPPHCVGHFTNSKTALGLWAIHDPEGSYQVGAVDLEHVAPEARFSTVQTAMQREEQWRGGLPNNLLLKTAPPSFLWLTPAPGLEDEVLAAMTSVFRDTPHVGGSSADNDVSGQWRQIAYCGVRSSPEALLHSENKESFAGCGTGSSGTDVTASPCRGPPAGGGEERMIFSNAVAYCICDCTAQVQGTFFTGYRNAWAGQLDSGEEGAGITSSLVEDEGSSPREDGYAGDNSKEPVRPTVGPTVALERVGGDDVRTTKRGEWAPTVALERVEGDCDGSPGRRENESRNFVSKSEKVVRGVVTKIAGPRHILEIDGEPAALVYDRWTGGGLFQQHIRDAIEEEGQFVYILGPSSINPIGQEIARDWDGNPVYRSIHVWRIVLEDWSLQLFCDIQEVGSPANQSGLLVYPRLAHVPSFYQG